MTSTWYDINVLVVFLKSWQKFCVSSSLLKTEICGFCEFNLTSYKDVSYLLEIEISLFQQILSLFVLIPVITFCFRVVCCQLLFILESVFFVPVRIISFLLTKSLLTMWIVMIRLTLVCLFQNYFCYRFQLLISSERFVDKLLFVSDLIVDLTFINTDNQTLNFMQNYSFSILFLFKRIKITMFKFNS